MKETGGDHSAREGLGSLTLPRWPACEAHGLGSLTSPRWPACEAHGLGSLTSPRWPAFTSYWFVGRGGRFDSGGSEENGKRFENVRAGGEAEARGLVRAGGGPGALSEREERPRPGALSEREERPRPGALSEREERPRPGALSEREEGPGPCPSGRRARGLVRAGGEAEARGLVRAGGGPRGLVRAGGEAEARGLVRAGGGPGALSEREERPRPGALSEREESPGPCRSLLRVEMETLDEFDQEYPLSKMFCRRLTKEEFESEALTYTEKALQDLFRTMDQNPSQCERVVRKRKQAELEKAGLKSFIKAKFFTAVDGRLNRCNAVGLDELQERLQNMKDEMRKVHVYACEAKGSAQRTSKRLAEKRQRGQGEISTSEDSTLPSVTAIPPPPPPPPPLPGPSNPALKTPLKDKSNLHTSEAKVLTTPALLENYGLARLNRRCKSIADLRVPENDNSTEPVQSIHSELLSANHFKRLRSTGVHRSPGGTPSKVPKSQQAQEGEVCSPASAFNTTLLNKFRNTKSPIESAPRSPSSSDSESSGFATPPGSP
ncbi:uncharacterized protein LOC132827477 [Hemiscyllium ocellatum]|uniref:uncharacterized protein LOC132827477 n=1 Tax=Hemiscyllium ocellatum TaxID=170820 RepID=UPI002966A8FC|nr:uncharacterized protein LOC132827477 [Hemiscyllium ocellatum]